MSYSHTKRRKTIAKLKRKYPTNWQNEFDLIRQKCIQKLDGKFIGSLEDILNINKSL